MKPLLLIALLMVAASDVAAQQQPPCGPLALMLEKFAALGEVPVAAGLVTGGSLLEILAAPDGSWTLFIVTPNKIACMTATGDGWRTLEPATPGKGA